MSLPIDDKNPGKKEIQRYTVQGGLSTNKADELTLPLEFLVLKNCLVDKRQGVLMKRPGSATESIASSLPLPVGAGEYQQRSAGTMIPVLRSTLVNFGGTFYEQTANVWTAVTATSRTSFGNSRPATFAKLGSNLFIAGGRPAKWGGPGSQIDRVGIVPPASPITITSYASGSGITLVDGSYYMYTYYNSTTGLESDWSELSALVPAITDKSIEIGIPAATAENWDKIRIYRTLDGGLSPYLVATVAAGTTTYTDSTPDSQLTAAAAPRYERAVPPNSYICAKYANCIWYVDDENPYRIVFSKPYTGADYDLEYFPADNYVISNEPVTGFLVVPGKMLVFHPRAISFISGYSIDDFVFQPLRAGLGTVFSSSVATDGSEVIFLAEQGFVSLNREKPHISREIDLDLQPVLAGSYNASLWVSCCWSPSLRQFLCMVSAFATAGAAWEDPATGGLAEWEDAVTLEDAGWEDPDGSTGDTTALTVKLWGWSPEESSGPRNIWHEYEFSQFEDGNDALAYPTFLLHPGSSSDTNDPQQDKTFIGFWNGSEGRVLTAFRKDSTGDDGDAITSEWVSGRICPGEQTGGYKFFEKIGFTDSFSDPTSDGNCTLKYLKDFTDPHLRNYESSLITIPTQAKDVKTLPRGLGRHLHLYGIDTSTSQSKILLSELFIHYRERFRRGGR